MPMQISISNAIGGGGGAQGAGGSSFTNTKSIDLDGVDDYVDLGNPTSLRITGDLSISAWFKTTSTVTQMIVAKDRVSPNTLRAYMLFYSGSTNTIRFYIYKTGGVVATVTSTSTVTDGNWHHVLATHNGTNMKIYIDGTLEDSNTDGGTIQDITTDVFIGRRFGSGGGSFKNFFNGNIDEVAIWNSDQSANASAIYNSGVPNDLASLSPLSWWRCGDGDTAPTLTDNGSGGNNGTMTNFSTFSTDVPT